MSTAMDTTPALHFKPEDLHIGSSIERFHTARNEPEESFEDTFSDPLVAADVVGAQTAFLRKLKFQYLEQNAKDKYVKYIVNDLDDAPLISAEDNKLITESNQRSKQELQQRKLELREKCSDVRNLAPLVEDDLKRAKRSYSELESLSSEILDSKLAIKRLRTLHPQPRLTISLASQQLEDQIDQMQQLADQKEDIQKKILLAKEKLKAANLKNEKLRVEKQASDEIEAKRDQQVADQQIVPLYEWYSEAIALHKAMSNLVSCRTVSENELSLTYKLPRKQEKEIPPVTISLIFVPDTQQIAQVSVEGCDDDDFGDLFNVYINSNDVPGAIAAILARIR